MHSSPRRPPQFNRRLTTLTVFGPKTRLIRHYDSRKFTASTKGCCRDFEVP